MPNDATLAQAGATEPPPPPRMGVITGEPMPDSRVAFNSSAYDTLTMRTTEIQALASCVVCLSAVERSAEGAYVGYELAEDALPLLGGVLMRLAREAETASHQLWNQYRAASDVANARGVQQ